VSEIQQNRYDQLLRRVGDLKGQGSKVRDALTELFPVIDVERIPGELLRLSGTRICVGSFQIGPTVGLAERIQVFNPTGSGVLATVHRMLFFGTVTNSYRISPGIIAFPTGLGLETLMDRRAAATERPTCQIRSDQTVALEGATIVVRLLAHTTYQLDTENDIAVLPPGTGLGISTDTVNKFINVTFLWRERAALPSELNF